MIITDKEKAACKEFIKILEPLNNENIYVFREVLKMDILSIQIDAARVAEEKGSRPNGDIISILDLERAFHRYHTQLKESMLKLQKLESITMLVRGSINKLMSENFSICHACKGRKGKEVEVDGQPDFEECVMCEGRGVLEK